MPPIPTARAAPRTPGPAMSAAPFRGNAPGKPPRKGMAPGQAIGAQFATLVQAAQPSVPWRRMLSGRRTSPAPSAVRLPLATRADLRQP